MLKWLAIFAVLLANLPIYGQEKSSQPECYQQNSQQISLPISEYQPKSDARANNSEDDSKGYFSRLFAAENIPNIGLFFAGVIGIFVAVSTLFAIRDQVYTFISKERARLVVDLQSFIPGAAGELWTIGLFVTNHGSTKAFIREARCLPCIESPVWDAGNASIHLQIHMPTVLGADESSNRFDAPVQKEEMLHWDVWNIDETTVEAIRLQEKKLFVVGYVEYEDVFGWIWKLRFSKYWRPMFASDKSLAHGEWTTYGGEKINREYVVYCPQNRRWRAFMEWMEKAARE